MALIKDVDSILKDRKIKVRKLGEKFEHTRLMRTTSGTRKPYAARSGPRGGTGRIATRS